MKKNENQIDSNLLIMIRIIDLFDKYPSNLNGDKEEKFRTKIIQILYQLSEQYPQAMDIWNFLMATINQTSSDNITKILNSNNAVTRYYEDGIELENDEAGNSIQNNLKPLQRKKLAANYTTINAAKIITQFLDDNREFQKIADPFCGSGRLITNFLDKEHEKYQDKALIIWINDILPEAVLIAFLRIILNFKKYFNDWKKRIKYVIATIGDAFEQSQVEKNTWDLIIMNPPYTRVEHLSKEIIENLKINYAPDSKILMGQPGLHIYAIFLANQLLQQGGIVAAVLPASTFLSQYSRTLQNFLMKQYRITQIIISKNQKAFSDDSEFREVLFYATKLSEQQMHHGSTKFIRILSNNNRMESDNSSISSILEIAWQKLQTERNWIKFLLPLDLQKWADKLIQSNAIKSGQELGLNIVRGVEMYGPDFFFLPNKYWNIPSISVESVILSRKEVAITNSDKLSIEMEYLIPCLRKPGLYNNQITPIIKEYAIKIPYESKISENLDQYIKITDKAAEPAKKQFGSKWKSHIHNQLNTKAPYGNLFFADKFGINTTGTIIYYTDSLVTCTKNFYVLKENGKIKNKTTRILAAWLSSSWYLLLFLYHRREIGGSYGRLQIMDLLSEPLFLDISKISIEMQDEILTEFDYLRNRYLPPIPQQLKQKTKWKIDQLFAEILGWNNKDNQNHLSELYNILMQELEDCNLRDS